MYQHTIECDQCKNDITYTGNCEDYRILLTSQPVEKRPDGKPRTLMATYPTFNRDFHFCGSDCFVAWVDGNKDRLKNHVGLI